MGITCIKRIIYRHKDYNGWRDYPRENKNLLILKVKKRSLSLML
jgi:hypothetical protein